MTEDLITDLSKASGLFVIARNSSFAYKGQRPDVRQVCRELGVRYVLEGSVRRSGSRVRINAQLIEGGDGTHIWAERYDRDLDDIFTVQDEVTAKIVDALRVHLSHKEKARIGHHAKVDMAVYDTVLRARERMWQSTPAATVEALNAFSKVVQAHPDYVPAVAGPSSLYDGRSVHG